MDVAGAAQTGQALATLVALRDTLALAIDECESKRDLPALSRQLTDVLVRIADATPVSEVDAVDEIAARRDRRRSSAASGATRAQGSP